MRSCEEGVPCYAGVPSAQLRIMWNFTFDRVVHHGRLIEYAGPSHRLENSLMLGKGGDVA